MTKERYYQLETDMNQTLTPEEREEGWHWCRDWDGALVGPGVPDMQESCRCV